MIKLTSFLTCILGLIAFYFYEHDPLRNAKPVSNFYSDGAKPPANCGRMPASSRKSTLENNITIPYGQVAYITEDIDADTITINGELHCNEQSASPVIEISAKTIIVNGLLKCGSSNNPYNKKLIISLKDSSIDPVTNPAYRGLLIHGGGKLELYGDRSKSGFVRLAETMEAGDDFIIVDSKYTKSSTSLRSGRPWSIGDEIVVGPTGFNYLEAEKFKVIGFDRGNPNKLYLDRISKFKHWGEKKTYNSPVFGAVRFDERAEVANLTRSIVIQADENEYAIDESNSPEGQRGGHVMVHHSSSAYIDSVEFYKMGQAGVMARYPFHWHYVGDASGQFIKNSSVHHSYQRCITVHRTQNARVQNNVCYNFKGHGYFLEDGNETGNKIIGNLAMMAKAPDQNKLLLASDDITSGDFQGRFPSVSGFWISNPDNYIVGNVVSGSVGTGIWMSFEKRIYDNAGNVVARPLTTATDTFNYNRAHATKVGITWDGAPDGALTNNPNNPNDRALVSAHYSPPVTPSFRGLVAYKNYLTGIYLRGQTAIFDKTLVAENGRSFWVSYNSIVKDSVFVGETDNQSDEIDNDFHNNAGSSRHRKAAMTLYDGPFEIHNADFLDFSTEPSTYRLDNGQLVNSTAIPFVATGGTSKFTNFVSGLRFNPEPAYRALLEDPSVYKERSYLGISRIRDLDGSLSGTGRNSLITGKRSLGVDDSSSCVLPGDILKNYVVCPKRYTESSLDFMRWGGSGHSPWKTPFILLRSDNKASYPIGEWNYIKYIPNSTVTLSSSKYETYKLLPLHQYDYDKNTLGAEARFEANSESTNPEIPIVEVVAYGRNCRLGLDAVQVASLSSLRNQSVTSYYSNGEKFFVKVVPDEKWRMYGVSPYIRSTANSTNQRFPITCDNTGPIDKRVIGSFEGVERTTNTTVLKGWACNYTEKNPIVVKAYAMPTPNILGRKTASKPVSIYLGQTISHRDRSEEMSVRCGHMSAQGRRFEIVIQNTELSNLKNHKFYVQGISNTGGIHKYLKGSGLYDVIQTR